MKKIRTVLFYALMVPAICFVAVGFTFGWLAEVVEAPDYA